MEEELVKQINTFGMRKFIELILEEFSTDEKSNKLGTVRASGYAPLHCPFPWSNDTVPSFAISVVTGLWKADDKESQVNRATGGDIIRFVEYMTAHRNKVKWVVDKEVAIREIRRILGIKGKEEYFLKCKMKLLQMISQGEFPQTRKPWFFKGNEEILSNLPIGYDEEKNAMVFAYYDYNYQTERKRYVSSKVYYLEAGHTPKTEWADQNVARGVMPWPYFVEPSENKVILCEGEPDALTLTLLGFTAVSGSGGAGNFVPKGLWAQKKVVFVYTDKDEKGENAKKDCKNDILRLLGKPAIVDFPDFPAQPAKTDISDYVRFLVDKSQTREEIRETIELLNQTASVEAAILEPKDIEPIDVSLKEANSSSFMTRSFRTQLRVISVESGVLHLPSTINIVCDGPKDDSHVCLSCALKIRKTKRLELRPDGRNSLRFMQASSVQDRKLILHSEFGINSNCRTYIVEEEPGKDVLTVSLSSIGDDEERIDSEILESSISATVSIPNDETGIAIRKNLLPGEVFTGCGYVYTQEKKNSLGMHFYELSHIQETPNCTIDEVLEIYKEITNPFEKLMAIAQDFSSSVTGIVGRDDYHMILFLLWHSIYKVEYRGNKIQESTLDIGIIGDTRTGKTEAFRKMAQFYQRGAIVDMKNATLPGIIGSSQKVAGGYKMVPGIIQTMSGRGPIAFDECKPEHSHLIQGLATIRSEGFTNVTKASSQLVHAQAPFIWFYNPEDLMSESPKLGVEIFKSMHKRPEDISRFDFATSVTQTEVEADQILAAEIKPSRYPQEYWRGLRFYVNNLEKNQIIFTPDFVKYAELAVRKMTAKYSARIPLVTSSDFLFKFVKLCATIACATFNAKKVNDDRGFIIEVDKEHIEAGIKFIYMLYDKPTFAYDVYSSRRESKLVIAEPDLCLKEFQDTFGVHWLQVVKMLVDLPHITPMTLNYFAPGENAKVKMMIQILSVNNIFAIGETLGHSTKMSLTKAGRELFLKWMEIYSSEDESDLPKLETEDVMSYIDDLIAKQKESKESKESK